ncbi:MULTISPECIES: TonB-dependent hemoglobin/transferrin/lactoferrin family receptor [unclassified Halomonas]|uniref:TonB-dependent hemoglobin/transferrin/lactoferrin family receptor n=1 Tax=unclassified Halomonas TaxID=2609666 RepID=UPI004034D20A
MHFKVFSRSPITAAVILGLLAAQTQVLAQAQPSVPNSSKALQQNPLQQRYTFDLPEQHLLYSLGEFTATTQIAVVRQDGQPINGTAPALRGEMTADEALRTLLADSSLTISYRNGRTAELLEPATSLTVGNQTAFSTLTVSADRIGDDWVYHEPRAVSVISREQIDRTPPRHAADMLQETPGVYSAVNAQDPGLSVNIRGMQDFGRVNMMVDGMRQNFNDNGHQQRNGTMYVDSELLSDVVIEKGASTGVHGAGAIAGSANFRTIDVDDVLLPGKDIGVRLRGMTGVGGEGNGVNFIGSAAVAGRFGDRLELLAARSNRNFGEYAPGRRRPNYDFLTVGVQDEFHKDIVQDVDRVRFTDNEQDSNLFKARFHIDDDQSLTFSYLGTELSYNNVSDRQIMRAGEVVDGDDAWRRFGDASTTSDSVSLRYNLNPSSPLINLEANAYFVSTEGQRYTEAGRPVVQGGTNMTELAWMMGVCETNPVQDSYYNACRAGLDNNNRTEIDTYGFTLENTARFSLGGMDGFSSNHGIEYFIDKGESTTTQERDGRQLGSTDNTMQPNGERSIASAFGNLQWENETFTLGAGLRYDYYRLKGSTQLPGAEWNYRDRFYLAQRAFQNRLDSSKQRCAAQTHSRWEYHCERIPVLESMVEDPLSFLDSTSILYNPRWNVETVLQEYDVDSSMDKLLPTLSAAYRPNENIELFANWGRGWRPPSLTETLMQGSHPGDPFAVLFPNPHAQPETSRSWDVGANFTAQNLFRDGDRFFSKLSYYDTRVDNYLITSMVNVMPGQVGGLGHTMFVPNLLPMNFRGLELEIDYDAENWYTQANYTHVLGSDNQFCQKIYPLGSGWIKDDMPNEDGSYNDAHNDAIEAGYDSREDQLDNQTYCGIDVIGMNSARQLPMDRGSLTFGTRWFDQRLDVGTRLNYSAGGGPEDFDFDLWPTYVTWDLYASYQVNPNLLLRATMLNVRDRNYVTGYSDIFSKSYGAGRTLMAGAELRF